VLCYRLVTGTYPQCDIGLCSKALAQANLIADTRVGLVTIIQVNLSERVASVIMVNSTPLTPLTGRAIKPQRQGHIGGPIAQP